MTSSSPKSNLCQACQAVITDTGPPPRKRRIELTAAAPEPDKDGLAPTADDESSDEEDSTLSREYTRQLRESDGFDVDVTNPVESFSMHKMKKNETGYFRDLTDIYARLGLHCYNSHKGTNFQLSRVDKFVNYGIFHYYITLEATDPAVDGSCFTFQASLFRDNPVNEAGFRMMTEGCRIKPETPGTGEVISQWGYNDGIDEVYKGSLPNWYSYDALMPLNDQFYHVQDSDILENDWLNLYAEVAMYALQENDSMSLFESWLPLEINKVVVQTFEDVKSKEKLKAANAIFYFSFKNLNAPPHGLCQDHRVIIRRTTDGLPGHICLDINSCTGRNIFKTLPQYR
ncbi:hypothetical protein Bca4012_087071 [Brassica carinata]|uniref:Uncharacterized protein n=2 Tax=Brassica oleracea TaxID=3712 RepID=A0A0D3A3F1_BRAOL|nr:PREDICTED: UPF0725 protein At4g29550 [Brassica oleracea var. oleracea]XP_013647680.1 UPF0725 protein At4g29550 [Brassica napus]VDD48559.1 unnamed protein product [Brassica oleracea]